MPHYGISPLYKCTKLYRKTYFTTEMQPNIFFKDISGSICFHWFYTIFTMKYLVMCNVYSDISGIKYLYHVCPSVSKIIHSLKLVDYLHVQADNPWYNYHVTCEQVNSMFLCSKRLFFVSIFHQAQVNYVFLI